MRPTVGAAALMGAMVPTLIPTLMAPDESEVNYRGTSVGESIIDVIGEARDKTPGESRVPVNPSNATGDDTYVCQARQFYNVETGYAVNGCEGDDMGPGWVSDLVTPVEITVTGPGSDADDEPADLQPVVVTREEVQSLLVDAGGLEVQPDRSWVLVHAETIAFSGAEQQILTTSVLGAPVQVRVIPEQFTWNFGDGSAPLITTDPGAPWPDHTVAHPYAAAQEDAAVSVTTEWDAAFRIVGMTTWLPVTGAVVTTESSAPFDVVTATPRLVASSS